MEKPSLERSQEIAEYIKAILFPLQIMMNAIPIEELEESLKRLEESTSIQRALPFPASQNKASLNEKKNNLYRAIINLMKTQKEVLDHKDPFINEEMLEILGVI